MNKKVKIAFIVLAIFVLIYLALKFNLLDPERREMITRCTGYSAEWRGVVDCYGVISIWAWERDGYAVLNRSQVPWPLAFIRNSNDFYIEGDEMYLIDQSSGECGNGLNSHPYCATFQVNGERKEFSYDTANQVPHYLVFNTRTGDQRFYAQLSDISPSDQEIFKKLSD